MTTLTKVTTVDTTNFHPGELIHMDFDLYNVNSIRGLISILTVVCENSITLCILPTESKQPPVHIICFILTALNNEQHPCKSLRVDQYGAFENSTNVTNLPVYYINISMETTGGDVTHLNGNNEKQIRTFITWLYQALLTVTNMKKKVLCSRDTRRSPYMKNT